MAQIGMGGMSLEGYGCANRGVLVDGFVAMEMASVDCSVATGLGVHNHLAMGAIHHCGSEEQKQAWLPRMAQLEAIGAFGLTEPEVGSGVARGLQTTARRDGDTWILNGAKRWIGNATFADVTVVWARDEADDQVKGFLVEKGTPGFAPTKMTHKIALRAVQSADIVLTDVEVAETARLQNANTFMDTADVLTRSRIAVAWEAVGCARGAYEIALQYAGERQQFGRPIARFQLVQDLLSRMLGNIVASQCVALRLSQLAEAGQAGVQHASLAKAFCTARMRETTGWARELLAGNGILLEYNVARFVADSEAIYSYEGTREINSLIVGLAITGESAFVGK
jgi:glutaryl-CoA dehydrogenase